MELIARLMNFKVTGDCFLKFAEQPKCRDVLRTKDKMRPSPNNISMLAESQRLLQFLKLI